MAPALAGLVTSLTAAFCYGICVSDSAVGRSVDLEEEESPSKDMTGEDISFHYETETTISSVGASSIVLRGATPKGVFRDHYQCFLPEVSPMNTDATGVSTIDTERKAK